MITPVRLLDGTRVSLVDEAQFFDFTPGMESRPIAGYAHVFAVFRMGTCVGWTTRMALDKAGLKPLPV